jgi:hypothetical protein
MGFPAFSLSTPPLLETEWFFAFGGPSLLLLNGGLASFFDKPVGTSKPSTFGGGAALFNKLCISAFAGPAGWRVTTAAGGATGNATAAVAPGRPFGNTALAFAGVERAGEGPAADEIAPPLLPASLLLTLPLASVLLAALTLVG